VLQVYRLMHATQTMSRCGEFIEMADMAVATGMPGEGRKVVELGIASKACAEKADQERLQRLLASATTAATEDRAGLVKLEAEAKAAKTGELDVVLGSSLFGYDEFSRATEALSRGITKGGLKNLTDAQFMLGMAQLRAGAKPEAVQTFRSIKAEEPISQRNARLWALYAGQ
jgi:TolA-binding protein